MTKRTFTARVWPENGWFIALAVEIDIASQGESEREALANLREAIELYYETLNDYESVYSLEVDVDMNVEVGVALGRFRIARWRAGFARRALSKTDKPEAMLCLSK